MVQQTWTHFRVHQRGVSQGIIVLLLDVSLYPFDTFQNRRDVLGLACKVFSLGSELIQRSHKACNRVLKHFVRRGEKTIIEEGASVGLECLLLFLYAMMNVFSGPPAMCLPCFANNCRWVVKEGVQDFMGYLGNRYTEDA